MRKLIQLLSFLFIIFSLASCVKYEEVEITDIKSLKLLELTDSELKVESEVQINNPNFFSIKVIDSDFNVTVENKEIGKARILSDLDLEGESNDYHVLVLESTFKDLKEGALMNLMMITAGGKDTIKFKVDGTIVGKALLMKKKVEVSHEGKVPLKLF